MIHRITVTLLLATLSFQQACAHPAPRGLGMKCYQSNVDPSTEECEANLYAVIVDPQRFEGKIIRVTGYMRRVYDAIVLYPSRDAYLYSAGRGGVELLISHPDDIEIMRGKQELEGATTVIGKFTSEINGRVRGSVGVVTGDITVFPEHEPGLPPPLPTREGLNKASSAIF